MCEDTISEKLQIHKVYLPRMAYQMGITSDHEFHISVPHRILTT